MTRPRILSEAFQFIPRNVSEVNIAACVEHQDRTRLTLPLQIRFIFFILFILEVIYVLVSVARFIYYRKQKQYQRLVKRSLTIPIITGIAAILQSCGALLADAVFYPCFIKYILLVIIVPLATVPPVLRLLDFYNKYVLAVAIQHALQSDPYESNNSTSVVVAPATGEGDSKFSTNSKFAIKSTSTLAKYCKGFAFLLQVRQLTATRHGAVQDNNSTHPNFDFTMELVEQLQLLTRERVRWFLGLVIMAPYLIFVVVAILVFPQLYPANNCLVCSLNTASQLVVALGALLGTLFSIIFALLLRHLNDPFEILRENLLSGLAAVFTLIGFGLHIMIPDTGYSDIWSMGYIPFLGYLSLHVIATDYQVYQAKKNERLSSNSQQDQRLRKKGGGVQSALHESSIQGGTTQAPPAIPTNVQECLLNPQFLPLFEKHMTSEFSAEILRMYLDCIQFEKTYYDMTEQSRKARAKKIVMMHVEDHAVMQVNLPFTIKTELLQQIETDRIAVGMFVKAETELLQMMRGCFNRFTKTKQFIQLRDEIRKSGKSGKTGGGILARIFRSTHSKVGGEEEEEDHV